jgi:hypothetical protein
MARNPGQSRRKATSEVLAPLPGRAEGAILRPLWLSCDVDHRGETDHFVSWRRCQHDGRHELVYEWLNERWTSPQMNQAKGAWFEPLDPFEVGDGWFELHMPGLALVATERVPAALREKADATLRRLGLRDGHDAMRLRRAWLERFQRGTPLSVIEQDAPLLGRALRHLLESPQAVLSAPQRLFRRDLERARAAASR